MSYFVYKYYRSSSSLPRYVNSTAIFPQMDCPTTVLLYKVAVVTNKGH